MDETLLEHYFYVKYECKECGQEVAEVDLVAHVKECLGE